MSTHGLSLSTNKYTTVKIDVEKRERQREPYGDCTDQKKLKGYSDFSGLDIGYSFTNCFIKKSHDKILSKCNCRNALSLVSIN